MADRLGSIGEPVDRATIARAESRTRGMSLDDAVAWSVALGPSLLHMIVPLDDEPYLLVAGGVTSDPTTARRWLRGYEALKLEDARTVMAERPASEVGAIDTAMWAMQRLLQKISEGAPRREVAAQLDAVNLCLALVANEHGITGDD
ncbi:MAG: hypothetical protein M3394_01430 [Actinomycetota bacterium]|nr:hypothetical protein [Actinomycetota bacterium]